MVLYLLKFVFFVVKDICMIRWKRNIWKEIKLSQFLILYKNYNLFINNMISYMMDPKTG